MATDWNKLKVVDLKAELRRRGLPQNGLKQELINRLNVADAETSTTEDQSPAESPASAESTPIAAEIVAQPESNVTPSQDVLAVDDQPAPPLLETQTILSQETPPTEDVIPASTNAANVTDEKEASSRVDTPAAAPSELIQDAQKRKRRSSTPTPSAKRVRPDDEQEASAESNVSENTPLGYQNGVRSSVTYEEVAGKDQPAALDPSEPIAEDTTAYPSRPESRGTVISTGEDAYRARVAMSEPRQLAPRDSADIYSAADDKMIEPSIHPATTALYIKNFMRPLRAPMVRDYLADLATPPGRAPDPSVIVDFYLDQVRTHAFVQFETIASASRVRSLLHDQVWPDERNRKALWVDFIPANKVREWTEKEQSGGRGNFVRWEVIYDQDEDGVVARLEEAGADIKAPRGPAGAPAAPRQPASLSGPNRVYPGIEAAPRGPRNLGGPRSGPGPLPRADPNALRTRASPPITFQPVGEDLARRRIDNIHSFVSRHAGRSVGGDLNRYTFENNDSFVDRGKEVFVGIRPPHRERERRERERRERGGGRGGRRDGPPYPRGDRYFGSRNDHRGPPPRSNDDRFGRIDDDRRPRYRDFRDERSARDSHRDSYRDRRY